MLKNRKDEVWKSLSLVEKYLNDVHKAIPLIAEQINIMKRLIITREKAVVTFMDLGCGDGILAAAILEEYPEAKGVLLDFSEPMLKAAQKNLKEYAQNLDFVKADYFNPTWITYVTKIAPFDVIVSGFSIHHQTDIRKQELYREIYTLLGSRGIFINMEHVSSKTKWVESIWDNYFIDSLYAMSVKEGLNKSRDQLVEEYYNSPDNEANILASVEAQCDWLCKIGFQDVDCYFKIFELAIFGGRHPLK